VTVTGHPYLVGDGPATFSTCLDLAVPYRLVYDTNRYYADLGVPVDATRRQIREAYQRLRGHRSARLTYIVTQLLDPDVRRRYDATPCGSVFVDDEVEGWIRQVRVQESSRLRSQGRVEEAEVLEAEPLDVVVDTEEEMEQDEAQQPFEAVWPWAFYLWGSECQDRERLREWQELLISALGSRKENLQLAIGFSGGMAHPWGVRMVGYRIVVFLDQDEQPAEAHAQAASRAVSTIDQPSGAPSMEINRCLETSARGPRQQPTPARVAATSPAPSSSGSRTARPPSSGS
jgi:hypothetical protein